MDTWSSDLMVAVAPEATYERLLAESSGPMTRWRMLRRPALVLLVIGVLVPIMAVQRVTIALVATAALSWSFVVAIQWIVGAIFVASAPGRRVDFRRALDLWFAGHLPYSLWMLVVFAAMANSTSSFHLLVVVSAVVPAIWTAAIASAFCRTVLGAQPSDARRRATAHAMAAWTIGLAYIVWAAGGMAGPVRVVREAVGLLL
jgi:hypothetical protein